jgi:CxxC motif-containing protein (DUF1111 family)
VRPRLFFDLDRAAHAVWAWGAATLCVSCLAVSAVPDDVPPEALSAGSFTVALADRSAFSQPAPVLEYRQRQKFLRGRQHFNQKWVVFPSLGGDWGLGPTFIADRCSGCHVGGGRGDTPKSDAQQLLSVLVRISIPGEDEHGGPKPHPDYGDQIQNQGLMGQDREATYLGERVPPEANLYLDWEEASVAFADGETLTLRKPRLRVEKLNFGPLGPEVMYSLRIAQPTFGLGLLEAVPESDLLAIAQRQKAQGANGRANYVWDAIGKRVALGRFGWKANQPSIRQQIAAAFHGDIGVTSPLFDQENCPPVQRDCAYQPPGNHPELIEVNWDELELWVRALAVPAQRNVNDPNFKRGARLFEEAKCAVCHVPQMKAGPLPGLPQMQGQVFHAYTDLLLHDMGDELADGRGDFEAGPRDWRTPPLWGLGLSQTVNGSTAMLHDGRARNATEAILWHGGEAQAAREAFRTMPKADREALLAFLLSI